MEEMLMTLEQELDYRQFRIEYEKKGPRFLVADVREKKTFQESFDRLVRKGCFPDILFLGLHYLLRSELRKASCRLPGKREVRSLEASLRKKVEEIRAFEERYEEAHRLRVFSHCRSLYGEGPHEYELYFNRTGPYSNLIVPLSGTMRRCVTDDMLAYADMLSSWWTPRSDVLTSFGLIYNCAYAKVATGKPQFSIVAELNSSFLGRPIEPATLRKSLSRFAQRYKNFYSDIDWHLTDGHTVQRKNESPELVDWPKLFGPKTDKSK
jgi:hypothetical protein